MDSYVPVLDLEEKKINIEDWIFVVNNNFDLYGIPDELKLSAIASFVRGGFAKVTDTYGEQRDQFLTILRTDYDMVYHQKRLKIQLREIKQTKSVEKYVSKFTNILNQVNVNGVSDEDQMIMEGLKPRIKFELEMRQPNTQGIMITLATQFEETFGQGFEETLNFAGKSKLKPEWQC